MKFVKDKVNNYGVFNNTGEKIGSVIHFTHGYECYIDIPCYFSKADAVQMAVFLTQLNGGEPCQKNSSHIYGIQREVYVLPLEQYQ